MTPADRTAMDAMAAALRSHDQALRMAVPVMLAALPQLMNGETLRQRWNMGRDTLQAFLEQYAGYRGAPGKGISIPIEVVLRLDPIAKQINSSVPITAAAEVAA